MINIPLESTVFRNVVLLKIEGRVSGIYSEMGNIQTGKQPKYLYFINTLMARVLILLFAILPWKTNFVNYVDHRIKFQEYIAKIKLYLER